MALGAEMDGTEFGGEPGLNNGAYDNGQPVTPKDEHLSMFWTDSADPASLPDATLIGKDRVYRTWPEQAE